MEGKAYGNRRCALGSLLRKVREVSMKRNGLLTIDHGRHGRPDRSAYGAYMESQLTKNNDRALMGVPL